MQNATALMQTRALRFITKAFGRTGIVPDMDLINVITECRPLFQRTFHWSRTPRKRVAGQLSR